MKQTARLTLFVLLLGVVVVSLNLATRSSAGGGRTLSYLHAIWTVSICVWLASLVARSLPIKPEYRNIAVAGILMILFYFLDPYSYGFQGGHTGIQPEFLWQRWATLALGLVVLVALWGVYRARALTLAWVGESMGFLLLNTLYIYRDGPGLRFFAGENLGPMPMLLVLAGVGARTYAILASIARRVDADRVG